MMKEGMCMHRIHRGKKKVVFVIVLQFECGFDAHFEDSMKYDGSM